MGGTWVVVYRYYNDTDGLNGWLPGASGEAGLPHLCPAPPAV